MNKQKRGGGPNQNYYGQNNYQYGGHYNSNQGNQQPRSSYANKNYIMDEYNDEYMYSRSQKNGNKNYYARDARDGGRDVYRDPRGGACQNNDSREPYNKKQQQHQAQQSRNELSYGHCRNSSQQIENSYDYSTPETPQKRVMSRKQQSRPTTSNNALWPSDYTNPQSRTASKSRLKSTMNDYEQMQVTCDNCRQVEKVRREFNCSQCGSYVICEMCYDDYLEKAENQVKHKNLEDTSDSENDQENKSEENHENIKCIYCWSKKTLTDICVKSLKQFGYAPLRNGQIKIPISSLSKDKVKKLANLRVIQKTLVYVIGLAPDIAQESTLRSLDFFGQYGKIDKIVINTNNVYNGSRGGPSYSAYMTFQNPRDSAIAILSVDQHMYNERLIRASFGTSKFCQFFLSGQKCTNKECLYLHELRSDLEAYTKEDMQNNKFIFQEQQKIAIKLSKALDLSYEEFKKDNIKCNHKLREAFQKNPKFKYDPVLPKPEVIYEKEFHFLDETLLDKQDRRQKKKQQRQLEKQNNQEQNQEMNIAIANYNATELEIKEKKSDEKPPSMQVPSSINISNQAINSQQKDEDPLTERQKQKNQQKNKEKANVNGTSIQLNNQKDLTHDMIDRSLSKFRAQNKAQGQNPTSSDEELKQMSKFKQIQENDTQNHEPAERLIPEQKQDNDIPSIVPRGVPKEQIPQGSIRFQIKPKKKVDNEDQPHHPIVPEQRQNKHQITNKDGSPKRDQQKMPITETTSADARTQITKNLPRPIIDEVCKKSQENIDSIFIGIGGSTSSGNFNATMTSTKTTNGETIKINPFESYFVPANHIKSAESQGNHTDHHYQGAGSVQSNQNPSMMSDQQLAAVAQHFMISPHLFQKKKESRFKFAHSVDPLNAKNLQKQVQDDDDEIEVPKNIQDLIERGIRTLSNSLSTVKSTVNTVKSTAAQEAQEEAEGGLKINTLNKMLQQQQMERATPINLLDIKELKERWYTKKEIIENMQQMSQKQQNKSPAAVHSMQVPAAQNQNARPISSDLKANCNTINPTEQINDSYNVTRVKYQIKQNSQTNNGGEEEKIAQNGRASRRNQNKLQRKK